MFGSFGCVCKECRGTGTIALQLRYKLCMLERLLGVEIVVKLGYACEEMAEQLGLGEEERGHTKMQEGSGYAKAVDFYPRSLDLNRASKDGKHWGNVRYDFLELVRPYFDNVWIIEDPSSPNKWGIHGGINHEYTDNGG